MPIFTQRGDIVASEKNVHTYTSEARLLSKARKLSKAALSLSPLIIQIIKPWLRLPRSLKSLGRHSGLRTGSHHLCGGGRSKTSDIEFWLQLYDVLLIKLQRTQTLTASTEKSASCSSKASINQQSINQLGSLQCRQHNNNHASPSVKLCNKDAI